MRSFFLFVSFVLGEKCCHNGGQKHVGGCGSPTRSSSSPTATMNKKSIPWMQSEKSKEMKKIIQYQSFTWSIFLFCNSWSDAFEPPFTAATAFDELSFRSNIAYAEKRLSTIGHLIVKMPSSLKTSDDSTWLCLDRWCVWILQRFWGSWGVTTNSNSFLYNIRNTSFLSLPSRQGNIESFCSNSSLVIKELERCLDLVDRLHLVGKATIFWAFKLAGRHHE